METAIAETLVLSPDRKTIMIALTTGQVRPFTGFIVLKALHHVYACLFGRVLNMLHDQDVGLLLMYLTAPTSYRYLPTYVLINSNRADDYWVSCDARAVSAMFLDNHIKQNNAVTSLHNAVQSNIDELRSVRHSDNVMVGFQPTIDSLESWLASISNTYRKPAIDLLWLETDRSQSLMPPPPSHMYRTLLMLYQRVIASLLASGHPLPIISNPRTMPIILTRIVGDMTASVTTAMNKL
jgi:hypothetical protein